MQIKKTLVHVRYIKSDTPQHIDLTVRAQPLRYASNEGIQ